MALTSQADEIFFGGAAGCGKTALGIGLALTQHHRSLILRRQAVQVVEIVDQLKRITGTSKGWRSLGYGGTLRTNDGRVIEVGGCDHEDDKEHYQGRPHDLYIFDEAVHFSRSQFRFITAWNRHENASQRCRVLLGSNPPTTPEGRWIVEEFAPWLDPEFPNPAERGELRYFTVLGGELTWLENGEPFHYNGELIKPRSRTFIPGRLSDNPILAKTNYGAQLQALPEPLRSQLLYGDFTAGTEDDPWQVIPTEWVRAAQRRWTDKQPDCPMSAIGVDVARGGKDKTVLAMRYGNWFAKLKKLAGKDTPDGPTVANMVVKARKDKADVYVDVIGIGASVYDHLKPLKWFNTIPINNASASNMRDRSGRLEFVNVRAASYWKLREALDPASGVDLALPPDNELLVDLCAAKYSVLSSGVKIEPKDDIIERLGRSPDTADAVVLAYWGAETVKRPPLLHTFRFGEKKQVGTRLIFCKTENLESLIIDVESLLFVFRDPAGVPLEPTRNGNGKHHKNGKQSLLQTLNERLSTPLVEDTLPEHGLQKLQASHIFHFADIDPETYQEQWGEPIPKYGKKPDEVQMSRQDAKRLWSLITRHNPKVIVFVDDEGNRAESVAKAVCDTLRLPRSAIWNPADSENKQDSPASNKFISAITKMGRNLVM